MSRIVDRHLVGFVAALASPSPHPGRLGRATLSPGGPFRVREHTSLTLTYTAGHHGMDDRAGLKVVMRFPVDGGALQFEDPAAPNYVTAETAGDAELALHYESFGGARPWFRVLGLKVVRGCLAEGDTITIRLGDTRQGSPGLKLQTFCEAAWELRVLVDAIATGHYVEVNDRLSVTILPGPPARWVAALPTRWPVGTPLRLGIKAEDAWGNPSDQADTPLRLSASLPVVGLPEVAALCPGQRALTLEGVTPLEEGVLTVEGRTAEGALAFRSNPTRITAGGQRSWWGDLHGQSGETVGVNPAEDYFIFARDLAFLDVCSHQGNDFQINAAFWAHLNALTARFNAPGRFLAIPGYEWSGNTAVGGDRNVYFRREGAAIRRSSHALLTDRGDIDSDLTTAAALLEALSGQDAVACAHVGGRWADLRRAHDGRAERSVEIHSAWGTFEWLLHDAFDLGYRVGVVANSDGHKGRPGASYPGAATFGAYGGLTCFLMEALTRDALFECLRARRHYGTTGARLDLAVEARFSGGEVFADDPALGPCASARGDRARMGDVVRLDGDRVALEVSACAGSPIAWIEVRAGREVVRRWRSYGEGDLGRRIRVVWEGANYRGRGRQVSWDGEARLEGARVLRASPFNHWNPERAFEVSPQRLRWQAVTTGNFGGFDAWIEGDGALSLETALVGARLPLEQIGLEPTRFDAGGLGRALSVQRLPDALERREARLTCEVPVAAEGDTPVWVCVTLEDGHQAWSSPIYLFRGEPS